MSRGTVPMTIGKDQKERQSNEDFLNDEPLFCHACKQNGKRKELQHIKAIHRYYHDNIDEKEHVDFYKKVTGSNYKQKGKTYALFLTLTELPSSSPKRSDGNAYECDLCGKYLKTSKTLRDHKKDNTQM